MDRLGIGYDAIDKWLLDRYQLPPHDRWRVRTAVFQGRQVSDATLAPAAHGLATRVLTGGFRVLRLSQVLGWVDLMVATGLAGAGLVLLITSHHAEGLVLGVISLVGSGLFHVRGCDARATVPTADSAQRGEGPATQPGRHVGRPGETLTKERGASWSAQVMPLAACRFWSREHSCHLARGSQAWPGCVAA